MAIESKKTKKEVLADLQELARLSEGMSDEELAELYPQIEELDRFYKSMPDEPDTLPEWLLPRPEDRIKHPPEPGLVTKIGQKLPEIAKTAESFSVALPGGMTVSVGDVTGALAGAGAVSGGLMGWGLGKILTESPTEGPWALGGNITEGQQKAVADAMTKMRSERYDQSLKNHPEWPAAVHELASAAPTDVVRATWAGAPEAPEFKELSGIQRGVNTVLLMGGDIVLDPGMALSSLKLAKANQAFNLIPRLLARGDRAKAIAATSRGVIEFFGSAFPAIAFAPDLIMSAVTQSGAALDALERGDMEEFWANIIPAVFAAGTTGLIAAGQKAEIRDLRKGLAKEQLRLQRQQLRSRAVQSPEEDIITPVPEPEPIAPVVEKVVKGETTVAELPLEQQPEVKSIIDAAVEEAKATVEEPEEVGERITIEPPIQGRLDRDHPRGRKRITIFSKNPDGTYTGRTVEGDEITGGPEIFSRNTRDVLPSLDTSDPETAKLIPQLVMYYGKVDEAASYAFKALLNSKKGRETLDIIHKAIGSMVDTFVSDTQMLHIIRNIIGDDGMIEALNVEFGGFTFDTVHAYMDIKATDANGNHVNKVWFNPFTMFRQAATVLQGLPADYMNKLSPDEQRKAFEAAQDPEILGASYYMTLVHEITHALRKELNHTEKLVDARGVLLGEKAKESGIDLTEPRTEEELFQEVRKVLGLRRATGEDVLPGTSREEIITAAEWMLANTDRFKEALDAIDEGGRLKNVALKYTLHPSSSVARTKPSKDTSGQLSLTDLGKPGGELPPIEKPLRDYKKLEPRRVFIGSKRGYVVGQIADNLVVATEEGVFEARPDDVRDFAPRNFNAKDRANHEFHFAQMRTDAITRTAEIDSTSIFPLAKNVKRRGRRTKAELSRVLNKDELGNRIFEGEEDWTPFERTLISRLVDAEREGLRYAISQMERDPSWRRDDRGGISDRYYENYSDEMAPLDVVRSARRDTVWWDLGPSTRGLTRKAKEEGGTTLSPADIDRAFSAPGSSLEIELRRRIRESLQHDPSYQDILAKADPAEAQRRYEDTLRHYRDKVHTGAEKIDVAEMIDYNERQARRRLREMIKNNPDLEDLKVRLETEQATSLLKEAEQRELKSDIGDEAEGDVSFDPKDFDPDYRKGEKGSTTIITDVIVSLFNMAQKLKRGGMHITKEVADFAQVAAAGTLKTAITNYLNAIVFHFSPQVAVDVVAGIFGDKDALARATSIISTIKNAPRDIRYNLRNYYNKVTSGSAMDVSPDQQALFKMMEDAVADARLHEDNLARFWHWVSDEVTGPMVPQGHQYTIADPQARWNLTTNEQMKVFLGMLNATNDRAVRMAVVRYELAPLMKRAGVKTLEELWARASTDADLSKAISQRLPEAIGDALQVTMSLPIPGHSDVAPAGMIARLGEKVYQLHSAFSILRAIALFPNYIWNNLLPMIYEANPALSVLDLVTSAAGKAGVKLDWGRFASTRVRNSRRYRTLIQAVDLLVPEYDRLRSAISTANGDHLNKRRILWMLKQNKPSTRPALIKWQAKVNTALQDVMTAKQVLDAATADYSRWKEVNKWDELQKQKKQFQRGFILSEQRIQAQRLLGGVMLTLGYALASMREDDDDAKHPLEYKLRNGKTINVGNVLGPGGAWVVLGDYFYRTQKGDPYYSDPENRDWLSRRMTELGIPIYFWNEEEWGSVWRTASATAGSRVMSAFLRDNANFWNGLNQLGQHFGKILARIWPFDLASQAEKMVREAARTSLDTNDPFTYGYRPESPPPGKEDIEQVGPTTFGKGMVSGWVRGLPGASGALPQLPEGMTGRIEPTQNGLDIFMSQFGPRIYEKDPIVDYFEANKEVLGTKKALFFPVRGTPKWNARVADVQRMAMDQAIRPLLADKTIDAKLKRELFAERMIAAKQAAEHQALKDFLADPNLREEIPWEIFNRYRKEQAAWRLGASKLPPRAWPEMHAPVTPTFPSPAYPEEPSELMMNRWMDPASLLQIRGMANEELDLISQEKKAETKLEQEIISEIKDSEHKRGDISWIIDEQAEALNIPPELLESVIFHESRFNPNAKSEVGAVGLMQLMEGTAVEMGFQPDDRYDPIKNVEMGAGYLRKMLDKYAGHPDRVRLALAAYNAGPGNVAKYGNRIPPFRETQAYVEKVMSHYRRLLAERGELPLLPQPDQEWEGRPQKLLQAPGQVGAEQ